MKQFNRCTKVFMFIFYFSIVNYGFSQSSKVSKIKTLQNLIDRKEIDSSRIELKKQIDYYKSVKQYDSLINYYDFVGSLTLANNNKQLAINRSTAFTSKLLELNNPYISVKAKIGLATIYRQTDDLKTAYDVALEAYPFLEKVTSKKNILIADLEYDLGYYALKLTDYPLAKSHFIEALEALKKADSLDYISLQRTYNTMGIVYWSESNMDSTKYYMEKSLKALNKSPKGDDFMNEYFRPALLKSNLAIVSQAVGKNNEAISYTESAIKNYQNFINNSLDESRKNNAQRNQLASIDNLGVFYAEVGEFKRAEELITYSYSIKKSLYDKDDSNVIISKIILAQAKINNRDLKGSAQLLDEAISQLDKNKNEQLYWKSAAYITRASVFEDLGDFKNAAKYFDIGYQINKEVFRNTFSKEDLEQLGKMAIFYAKQGDEEKALKLAYEAYNYTKESSFKNSVRDFYSTTNLAETYFQLKKFKDAEDFSEQALKLKINTENNKVKLSDSIVLQFEKPRAITIHCKSKYELEPNKTEAFLLGLLKEAEAGISILNQRKAIIKSHNDLATLISQNKELFDFTKQIRLELYQLTKDMHYIDNLVVSHESGIYSRIRSRLNIRENMAFSNIPQKLVEREHKLKTNINKSLLSEDNKTINLFFEATKQWDSFLDSLKINYPKYYKMRYATIEESLDGLKQNIPNHTSIVRYLFINNNLYALVISNKKTTFHKLETDQLTESINKLTQSIFDIESTKTTLHQLYKQLWQPIENDIKTKNVIIIPDGQLFNLSFETLISKNIDDFSEMAKHSLLSKYTISYNYSLLLVNKNESKTIFNDNFIGFAPEFSSKMKSDYQLTITDSIGMDNTYLKLLPQPFTKELAKISSKLFKGKAFLNEKASKRIFTTSAKEHKIIHIGTHAESNNISPELSRLIFAKNINDTISSEDNSLYTYEIYNQNLSSNLAILTACETGKPTYQAGEGMISLAHAFNYAGSESMLTSLWKIDEKSSAQIIEHFYGYLKKGLPKDEALQKAKLDYLAAAKGRTLAPQYWAGLVLIGDTSAIDLQTSSNLVFWLLGGIIIILLAVFLKKKRRS